MHSYAFWAATLALTASHLVSGQTSTKCNPTGQSCPADPAFGKEQVSCDFTSGDCTTCTPLDGTSITYGDQGAVFRIAESTDAPTVQTNKYLFFGRVDMALQASNGVGIVSSVVLQSDDLDEIDWECLGSNNTYVQSNYFSKGNTTEYNRGAFHSVDNPIGSVHTYSILWTKSQVQWLIDNVPVRTVTREEAEANSGFPQSPMQVRFGSWIAGRSDAPVGTVEWAGGYTDFSQAPFIAYYKNITITDYAGGDGPGAPATQYVYTDMSGSWESIGVE